MSASTGRRERKRQQTAVHLAQTAWALFEAHGFENVTMESIAEAADVAKRTLYKHFPAKEALLRHHFHRELEMTLPALFEELAALPTAAERLRAFFLRSADWSETHRGYLPHYLNYRLGEPRDVSNREHANRSGLDRAFAALIEEGQERGEFRADMPAPALADYLEFLYLGALLRWLGDPRTSLPAELEGMLDLFLHGAGLRP